MTPQIALVAGEVYPLSGGGIGAHVGALAQLLEGRAEVTVVTTTDHEPRYRELHGDPSLPGHVRFAFVPQPAREDIGSYFAWTHRWSALVYEELRRLFPPGERVLVEVPDYLGQAAVIAQGRRGNVAELRGARLAVRLHTSAEMCAILNGFLGDDREARTTFGLERFALSHADVVLWQGGDVLRTYRKLYGHDGLAPTVRLPNAFIVGRPPEEFAPPPSTDILRLLYFGRLERRKGVQNLIRAATSLMREDWHLTLVGSDTETAPLGGSIREQLELMAADDPRIEFLDEVPRDDLPQLIADHHAVVLPSLWECWPNTALEALQMNRPVIATPTGGFVEMIETDRSGWLTQHPTVLSLTELLEELLEDKERVLAAIETGGPRSALSSLADGEALVERYLELAGSDQGTGPPTARREPRLVSVVIPYFQLDRYLEETVRSAFEQTYPNLEVLVVNDGSLRAEDAILFELAERYGFRLVTQPNAGLGAARNAGIKMSRGYYVFPLDADNVAEPEFVERCVEVLDGDESLAFVTSWTRYIDDDGTPHHGAAAGYQPLGNWGSVLEENMAGDAAAVIRRRIFDRGYWYSQDLTSYEDWQLYRELHAAGLYGHVIPERLLRYRLRGGSMLRDIGLPLQGRLKGEMDAHLIERRIEWESRSA
jgi:glycogen(starch) synthase